VAAAAAYASGYEGWGPIARYNRSRFHVVDEAIQGSRGALLDIGCGPGMLVRHLLEARPDLRITACDQSAAMVDAVAAGLPGGSAEIELEVASIEDMPFADGSFDVVVALGVLEYVDGQRALSEIARVVRPGGTVVVTMLNPASPYRLFEWCVYWPARRALGQLERLAGVPPERRHGAKPSGIRAIRRGRLRRLLRGVGLDPIDDVAYDVTPFVPPFDRLVRRWARQWRQHPERTVSRGGRRWLGTGYLIRAQRPHR
jgi:ubiquinone/menaquinone biosynthesis C-methylase UbiE